MNRFFDRKKGQTSLPEAVKVFLSLIEVPITSERG